MLKNLPANAGDSGDVGSIPGLEEEMATHSVFLSEKSHGKRSLVGCSQRVAKLDMS